MRCLCCIIYISLKRLKDSSCTRRVLAFKKSAPHPPITQTNVMIPNIAVPTLDDFVILASLDFFVGDRVDLTVGDKLGTLVGRLEGFAVGDVEGLYVCPVNVGDVDGRLVGLDVGCLEGILVGVVCGDFDGDFVGFDTVGLCEGLEDCGECVGDELG